MKTKWLQGLIQIETRHKFTKNKHISDGFFLCLITDKLDRQTKWYRDQSDCNMMQIHTKHNIYGLL